MRGWASTVWAAPAAADNGTAGELDAAAAGLAAGNRFTRIPGTHTNQGDEDIHRATR